VSESFFEELKRYVRFGPGDEDALRAFAPLAAPRFGSITDRFYARLLEHESARAVFATNDMILRLKHSLADWLALLFAGPWDEAYFEKRARIGRVHVRIGLPQKYMFGAMNLIRLDLIALAQESFPDRERRVPTVWALSKILDLELGIMLETYREAFVEEVQRLERLERHVLENQLAISEARYQEIVEKSEAVIATCDAAGTLLLFNRRCEEIRGMPREEALGRNFVDLFSSEDKRPELLAAFRDVLAGRRAPPFEGMVPGGHGGRKRRVRWQFASLPGGSGDVVCAFGLDVTEEHDLALRTSRAERLAALGTMAAGLAHEIRNPLNAASLQLTVVQRRLKRPSGADVAGALEAAQVVSGEMQRLAGLVREFLDFARPQPLRLSRVDLRAAVEEVGVLLLPESEASGVNLAFDLGPEVRVELDAERIKQVILNLVQNAAEATGPGGHVRVRVSPRDGGALLEVEDDGPGLPEDPAMVFEPFFTTKPGGTGLGLAIVHRIVTDHGGRIDCESRPGATRFSVFLPSAIVPASTAGRSER
jgi:PAS domain S-box-containing protein